MDRDTSHISQLHVVLPVHNEEETIGTVLQELADVLRSGMSEGSWIIVVSEDGSTDQTRRIVEDFAHANPGAVYLLDAAEERLGYSRAIIRAFESLKNPGVACVMDSDGQCDPNDLLRVAGLVVPGKALGVGFRSPRLDSTSRKLYSALFGIVHRSIFRVTLKDPSCPIVAIAVSDIPRILGNKVHLDYGYWWEFQARANAAGLSACEVAVRHRIRLDGSTRVYHFRKLPKIASTHLIGMVQLRRELSSKRV